jgi:hypothetical protein
MRQAKLSKLLWGSQIGILLCCPLNAQSKKIQAQSLVEVIAQKHSEFASLEIAAAPVGKNGCITIAATETKDLGEKCDKDETTALSTRKPFVEHEPDGFDVTAPLHDATGKLIGTIGIAFKPQPGQTEADILKRTAEFLEELEQRIPSKASLFRSASGG